jgi:hypothetical protein
MRTLEVLAWINGFALGGWLVDFVQSLADSAVIN